MKKLLSTSVAAAMLSAGLAAPAMAEVPGLSANAGYLSDYYFRGVHLGESSPYVGLDYENSGFYVGTWAVDDATGGTGNNGLEVDYYLGYGMEIESFSWSVGFTGYEYTYVDDNEGEINLNLGYAGFGLSVNVGEDNNPSAGGEDFGDHKYRFVTLGWSGEVFGVLVGNYDVTDVEDEAYGTSTDDGYSYLELSAGGEVGGFDLGVTIGRKFDIKDADSPDADADGKLGSAGGEYIFVDIGKSFSF